MLRHHLRALIVTLLALASVAALAAPQSVTLANGLRLVVEEDHSAPVAAVYFFVGTGSSYEERWLGSGLSHLLEHCLDEATTTRTREQVQAARAELGNNSNAWTSKDICSYYIVTSGKQVIPAIDHVADYVFHATFPEEQVKTQQGIIQREMARGEDDPSRTLYDAFWGTAFHEAPDRHPIIGYLEQFSQLTRDDVVAYYQRAYVPENVVASVVGDFSATEVLAHLRELLDKEPARAYRRPALPSEPPQVSPRRTVKDDPRLNRAYLMLGYPSVSLSSPDMYPLDVAAYVLGNGAASRLVARLRDEQGLVDGVSAFSHTPAHDGGIFGVSAVMDPAKLAAAEQAILAELRRLQAEPVTPAELARAKQQKEADLVFGRTTAEGRATSYATDLLIAGDVLFGERYVVGIRTVTAADVQRVARQYFLDHRLNVAVLQPPAKASGQAAAATVTAEARIERATLSNGLRLLVQENHSVPVVNVFLTCPGGLRYETEQNVGITSLMAQMLVRGTKTRSRLQIAQALEDVGGSLGPFSGRNSFGLSAQVLRQHLPLALEVVGDVLRNPVFPAAELEQQKHLTLAALAARGDDVDTYAGDLLLRSLFTAYPYRFPAVGTPQSIKALGKPELFAFHKRLCQPNAMVMAVFGDTTLDEARRLAEKRFGDWPAGAVAPASPPAEPPLEQMRLVEEKRDQQQAIISYGFPGPKVTDPERYQRDTMNAVFSGLGYPGGRLHRALRDAQLVYATWAYAIPGPDTGFFVVYAGTAPDKVTAAREQIEAIIRDLQAAPPSADELALAKGIALANQAVELQGSGARAQSAGLDELLGLGAEEMFRYAEGIQQVTAEQVQAQARKWLDLSRCVVVVTTP
jgi:zinc protease